MACAQPLSTISRIVFKKKSRFCSRSRISWGRNRPRTWSVKSIRKSRFGPTPSRKRMKSGPMARIMSFTPLCPPSPRLRDSFKYPGEKAMSSWTTIVSAGIHLKYFFSRICARDLDPLQVLISLRTENPAIILPEGKQGLPNAAEPQGFGSENMSRSVFRARRAFLTPRSRV